MSPNPFGVPHTLMCQCLYFVISLIIFECAFFIVFYKVIILNKILKKLIFFPVVFDFVVLVVFFNCYLIFFINYKIINRIISYFTYSSTFFGSFSFKFDFRKLNN